MQALRFFLLVQLVCGVSLSGLAQAPAPVPPRKAAVFVDNRAGPALNDKVVILEDLLAGRVTDKGFSLISREVVINALKSYTSVGTASASAQTANATAGLAPNQAATAVEAGQSETAKVAVSDLPTQADRALTDGTSALRLAQSMGADYLFAASILSFGTEKKTFQDGALKTVNVIHSLRVSYKVLDASHGGSLIGDVVKSSKTTRFTENSQTENTEILNDLLDDASLRIAETLDRKRPLPPPVAAAGAVEIIVSCAMTDLLQQPLSVPDVTVAPDGTLFISTNRLGIQVLDATVEVDGIAVGSAPGKLKVRPGLAKMRVSREGFKTWERTVNFSEGQKFNVALQMSAEGYVRWKDTASFIYALERGRKLTDATVEMMNGFGQTLRQSGYRIDNRSDVKADLKTDGKSLFEGLTIQPSIFR